MLEKLWPLLLFFAVVGAALVVLVRWQQQARRQREDALRTAAALHGWTFESQDSGPWPLMRWQGTHEGTRWTLEYRRSRRTKHTRHGRAHRVVWWADTFRGPSAPVVFLGVPAGQENPFLKLAQSEGMLATMAQKAAGFALDQALDARFGEEAGQQVDAKLLRPVEDAHLPGFMVMAVDVPHAKWMLDDGWSKSMAALALEPGATGATERPWVMVLPRRVLLARSTPIRTPEDVQAMVREGMVLVTANG
jgi:hypothetical protein